MLSPLQLASAIGCTPAVASLWHQPTVSAMGERRIDKLERMAAFLANIGHESASLSRLQENLNYSAQRLMQVWPRRFPTLESAIRCEHAPERLANLVYGGRGGNGPVDSGDGWRYRARGPIGITFADNYRRCGVALNLPLLEQPDLLLQPVHGARAAAWFWEDAGCNACADARRFDAVCDRINIGRETAAEGDSNGFDDRLRRYLLALKALA